MNERLRSTPLELDIRTIDTELPGRRSSSAALQASLAPSPSGLLARKANGSDVVDGAETAVGMASSSAAHALPEELRAKFETSLGTDLSGVRVHTGTESQHAASAVGAKAYAMGDDIHFAAGEYNPASQSGQHLLAHEVAHTVQQRGGSARQQYKLEVSSGADSFEHEADRAADAMVAGAAAHVTTASGIMRKPNGGTHTSPPGLGIDVPPDMTPMAWKMGNAQGPEVPTAISIPVAPTPPLPKGVSSDPSYGGGGPGCDHKPEIESFFNPKPKYDSTIFDRRRYAWAGLTASAGSIETIYNTAVPSIAAFSTASKDKNLKEMYEFQLDGKDGKNLHQVANEQVVPRTSPSGKTVGDTFQKVAGVSVGRDANTKGLEGNIDRAKKSKEVEAAFTELHGKEAGLSATVAGMGKATKLASEASHRLLASGFKMAEVKAEGDKADAEAKKAAITGKIATIKGYVDGAVKVVGFVAGAIAAPGAAVAGGVIQLGEAAGTYTPNAAPAPTKAQAAGGAVKAGADTAASGISMVAEKVLNYIYAADLNAASTAIEKATQAYRDARGQEATESWLADCDHLGAMLLGIVQAAGTMKMALMERKGAYQKLADAAAKAGGGTPDQQDRMKAMIMAIPVAKAVVAQASNVLNAVNNEPPDDEASRIGAHMSVAAGQSTVLEMGSRYGMLLGYRSEYKDRLEFWNARVQSLESVLGKMGG